MRYIYYIISISIYLFLVSNVYGGQEGPFYRIYIETGGMNVTELGINEGHKSYHMLGGEVFTENTHAKMLFGLEGFIRGEAPEEDPEIPCIGGSAFTEYSYKWKTWAHPYLGIRYDHFSRGTAPKYDEISDEDRIVRISRRGTPVSRIPQNTAVSNLGSYYPSKHEQVTEHDLVSARGGFHFKYKYLYADLGTIIPFYTNTKSGNFGPDLGIGFKVGNWDVGYRFREYRLTDNHFSGDEALSFYFSGVQLGYKF